MTNASGMNAVILSGGFGNRLRPLTDNLPKPMLTVANTPILDYSISHLYQSGIRDFVFTLAFMPNQIIDFAIGYSGIQCRFSIETQPLGTLGGIKACEHCLSDVFLVTSGDIIEDIDFDLLLNKHMSSHALVTVAVTEVSDPSMFGVCELDGFGNVIGFNEKPPRGTEKSKLASCGVYVFSKSVLRELPENVRLDIASDLLPALVHKGLVSAYIHDGYWRDTGTLSSYFLTNFECAQAPFFAYAPHRKRAHFSSFRTAFGEQNIISATALTDGAVRRSIVGAGAHIHKDSEIESCIVLQNASVRGNYRNCIIGESCVIAVDGMPFVPAWMPNWGALLN